MTEAQENGGGAEGTANPRARRGGRRASIIAGRRPATRAAEQPPEEEPAEQPAAEEQPEAPQPEAGQPEAGQTEAEQPAAEAGTEARKPTRAQRGKQAEAADDAEEAKVKDERPRRRRRRPAAAAEEGAEAAAEAKAAEGVEESAAIAEEAAPPAPRKAPAREAAKEAAPRAPTRVEPDGLEEIRALRRVIEEQRQLLTQLQEGVSGLGREVKRTGYRPRLGVFVDVPNLLYGQDPDERPINVGKLLDYLREDRELIRATAYSPVSDDPAEPVEQQKFVAPFVPYDYRIVTKPLKRFADGSIKGNFDVEMAIDMLTMADRLDVIAIVSGDADFARAVEVVQSRGVRVEVVAFARSTSLEMRALADGYVELAAIADKLR